MPNKSRVVSHVGERALPNPLHLATLGHTFKLFSSWGASPPRPPLPVGLRIPMFDYYVNINMLLIFRKTNNAETVMLAVIQLIRGAIIAVMAITASSNCRGGCQGIIYYIHNM